MSTLTSLQKAFAPAGVLRASINLGNPLLVRRAPETAAPVGVSIDLAQALAKRLDLAVVDGDDLHLPESVAKMRAGIPLQDEDRWPWLDRIGQCLDAPVQQGHGRVVACSALKRAYRDLLRAASPGLRFVFLDIDRDKAEILGVPPERVFALPPSMTFEEAAATPVVYGTSLYALKQRGRLAPGRRVPVPPAWRHRDAVLPGRPGQDVREACHRQPRVETTDFQEKNAEPLEQKKPTRQSQ